MSKTSRYRESWRDIAQGSASLKPIVNLNWLIDVLLLGVQNFNLVFQLLYKFDQLMMRPRAGFSREEATLQDGQSVRPTLSKIKKPLPSIF